MKFCYVTILLAFLTSQSYGYHANWHAYSHHKPRGNDYTNCCGIDKSTIKEHIHSACKKPSEDFASVLSFDKDAIMNIHAACRNGVSPPAKDMPTLVWDDTLACVAQQYAQQCQDGHDKPYHRELPGVYSIGVGQNLGIAWGDVSFDEIAKGWCDEKSNWEYGVGQIVKNDSMPVGHFTQMVWGRTTAFGCGAAQCKTDDKKVFICNYGPGGNVKRNGVDYALYPYEKA